MTSDTYLSVKAGLAQQRGRSALNDHRERENMEPRQVGLVSVLVVDDDDQLRQVVKDGLDIGGEYIVVTAEDGAAGIRAIERSVPDIILLDMFMVPSSGFSVLQHLQNADLEHRPRRVIAMSGVSDGETVARILALGADAVLSKPFTLGELRQTCKQAQVTFPSVEVTASARAV